MPTEEMFNSYGIEQLIKDFQNNMINAAVPENQELFILDYNPVFEISRTGGGTYSALEESNILNFKEDLYFGILRYEAESISNMIIHNYDSIETKEPIIDSYQFFQGTTEETGATLLTFNLSEQENEIISYKKPIEFQLSINDEITSAEDDYINSIPRKEIQFDILSSLGVIATEGAITESTTTGTSTEITSTTGVITDVGGSY